MKVFEANPVWLLMAVFYALIHDSLNCTFRSVTDNFSASLKGIYNVTTEQECLSKCSADPDCTFLTYYEGRCEVFENGEDVQKLESLSKAFSYSFEEQESSCPTTIVSMPQTSTMKLSTAPSSLPHPCKEYHKMYIGEVIVTKKNLLETPEKIYACKYVYYSLHIEPKQRRFSPNSVPENCSCTLKTLEEREANLRLVITDYPSKPRQGRTMTVCGDYNGAYAPNAVTEYICTETGEYIYVVDNESGANPEFPDFNGLERVKTSPVFYMGDLDCYTR